MDTEALKTILGYSTIILRAQAIVLKRKLTLVFYNSAEHKY